MTQGRSEWDDVATVPDGMTMADLRAALAERMRETAPVVAAELPPSVDETKEMRCYDGR